MIKPIVPSRTFSDSSVTLPTTAFAMSLGTEEFSVSIISELLTFSLVPLEYPPIPHIPCDSPFLVSIIFSALGILDVSSFRSIHLANLRKELCRSLSEFSLF